MDEFASPSDIKWRGTTGVVQYGGGDRSMVVMFYTKAVHNPAKSTNEGKPHYDNEVFVRIHPPGERLNIVDRKASDADKRRFPIQWQQYQQNKEQIPDGTPIDLLYPENPAVASMLRAHGVHTIELCSDLSGNAIDNIGMGAQRYVNDAIKYMDMANRGVKASQLRTELEERDRKIASLERTVEELQTALSRHQENALAAPNLQQLQALIAGAMARPQHIGQGFDSQAAQINALSAETRGGKRSRPKLKE